MKITASPKLLITFSTLIIFCLPLILSAGLLWAESTTAGNIKKSPSFEISRNDLQNKIDSLNAKQGLDEEIKTRLLKFYQSALDQFDAVERFQMLDITFQDSLRQAPLQSKALEKEIEREQRQLSRIKPENYKKIPPDELKLRLIIEKRNLSNLNAQIKKLENNIAVQINRPDQIRQGTLKVRQQIESAQDKWNAPHPVSESKLEIEARKIYLNTMISASAAELKALEIETISNPVRVAKLKMELQLLELKRKTVETVLDAIENTLFKLLQLETEKIQEALSQAEVELIGKPDVIQLITRDNIQYSRNLKNITEKTNQYSENKEIIDDQIRVIEKNFKSAEKKISLAGLSPILGKILREQRRNLSIQAQSYIRSDAVQRETALTGLEQFNVENKLKDISDIDSALQHLMEQVDPALSSAQKLTIQAELRELLNTQKELLNKLSNAELTFLRTLGDYSFARQQILDRTKKFTDYLDERLLWVPSSAPINSSYLQDLYHSLQWFLSPLNWLTTSRDFSINADQHLFLSVSVLIVLLILLFCKPWIKRRLKVITEKVEKPYTDHFYYTLQSFAYILILSSPFPLFINYLGWLLVSDLNAHNFCRAVGEGFRSASIALLFLQFVYHIFAREGIARTHFLWEETSVELMRSLIAWIRFIAVPAIFIIYMTGTFQSGEHSDSLGRFALIITMIMMSYLLSRVLWPKNRQIKDYIKSNPDTWVSRMRYVWYPGVICIPLIVAGFALAGYYLSALELQQKLIITMRFIFVTIIIHELVVRWLTLINRKMALKNARQKRKTAELSAKKSAGSSEEPMLEVDEELLDIPRINAQTLKLLNVAIGIGLIIGFWITWEDILPAFSFLDNVVLWKHAVTIDNQETLQAIVLTNLLLAGLYTFITIVAVRNFPGFMEVLVYRRFSMDSGSRYAFNQIAQYILITIGFISVTSELGGSWAKVQWLVAALSVGLGFGLQEIFANLVSGIILLIERPVRIGDTVTVGDITGKVSRIQMRATRIVDWDQKELVIPNKTFITGQLVNWTLSNPITRLVIPVGIAYGSDIELAYKVITDTVRSTPLVLSDPEPCVYFVGFGDSSLDFSIRVYVDELNKRLPLTHDLHVRINHALREHQIEIPFPQRDIHVRSGSLVQGS